MRTRVFSPTYPTWALVGGTSRPAGETVTDEFSFLFVQCSTLIQDGYLAKLKFIHSLIKWISLKLRNKSWQKAIGILQGQGVVLMWQCSAWQGCEKVQISCLAACVECRYCRELLQMLINSFQMSQLRDERGCRLQKPELQSDTVGNLFSR